MIYFIFIINAMVLLTLMPFTHVRNGGDGLNKMYYLIRRIQPTNSQYPPSFQVVFCGSTYEAVANYQRLVEEAVPKNTAVSYYIDQYDSNVSGQELTQLFIRSKERLNVDAIDKKKKEYAKSFLENYEEYLDPAFNGADDALEAF